MAGDLFDLEERMLYLKLINLSHIPILFALHEYIHFNIVLYFFLDLTCIILLTFQVSSSSVEDREVSITLMGGSGTK